MAENISLNSAKTSSVKGIFSLLYRWVAKVSLITKLFTKDSFLFLYIALPIAAAEITLTWRPLAGVYVNALAFAMLMGLAVANEKSRKMAISVGILPVVNMILLSIPHSDAFSQSVVMYEAILLLAIVYRFIFTIEEPLKVTKIGLKNYALLLPVVIVLGQILGVIGYGLLRKYYPYDHVSLPLIAFCSVVFAFAEESLFRGLIQHHAAQVINPKLAAGLSAILFALANLSHETIMTFLFTLLAGTVIAIVYYNRPNIILTTILNASYKLAFLGLLASFTFH